MDISRRNLLAFGLAFTFIEQGNAKAAPTQFNAYVTINPDNSIIIQSPAAEPSSRSCSDQPVGPRTASELREADPPAGPADGSATSFGKNRTRNGRSG